MVDRALDGRRVAVVMALLMVLCGVVAPHRAVGVGGPVPDRSTPAVVVPPPATVMRMSSEQVQRVARAAKRLQQWRHDHPVMNVQVTSELKDRTWTVSYDGADKKTHSQVIVDDVTGTVKEVRLGPQVAWGMARGYKGAFGRSLTRPLIWIPLFLLFLIPLIRWRRPFTLHTLDLLMLCGFGVSLVWFNRGEIFTSVPLAYPSLAYLFVRLVGIGFSQRRRRPDVAGPSATSGRPRLESVFPTWLLVSILLFVMGLRIGLNAFDANVIDVGYAGVIGADRIEHGRTPYGTFPSDCSQCDTYGPFTYLTYVPFERVMPWVGKWNDLPAAHGAAVTFDILALIGLIVLGWRLGGHRLGVGLGLAWAAYPFSAYALESNSNDSLVAAILVWGLVVAHRPVGRGIAVGLAAWAKFAPAILLVLWLRHPFPRAQSRRRWAGYLGGLAVATALAAWPVVLDGGDGVRRFWSRTLAYQLDRESPFSIWGQHPGLRPLQLALEACVVALAVVVVARPRSLDLRGFAALSGALLLGLHLTMPHWFYLYIPWFLPFALVALVPRWPRIPVPATAPAPPDDDPETHLESGPAPTGLEPPEPVWSS